VAESIQCLNRNMGSRSSFGIRLHARENVISDSHTVDKDSTPDDDHCETSDQSRVFVSFLQQ
jgi:hypothetical protein